MKFICPVCFYPNLDEYPNDSMSYEICPCCYVEFGYDGFEHTFMELRVKWILDGKRFISSEYREMSANDKKFYEELLVSDMTLEKALEINRLRANGIS